MELHPEVNLNTKKILKINSNLFDSSIEDLGDGLFLHKRNQIRHSDTEFSESIPGVWAVFSAQITCGQISIFSDDHWLTYSGSLLLYVPPFTAIRWRLRKGEINWECVISRKPIKNGPGQALILLPKINTPLKTRDNLENLLSESSRVPILPDRSVSAVAEKVKKALDETHLQNISISDIFAKIGYSHSTATHSFKACYGLSPARYRQELRFMRAEGMLIDGLSVVQVSERLGFSDPSHFSRDFKKYFGVNPSMFRNS